jgi:hypothetical protein
MLILPYQSVMKVGLFFWYQCNKESITNKYCENKSKPQLHCNGKCHLKKQLSKVDGLSKGAKSEVPEKLKVVESSVYLLPTAISIHFQHFYVLSHHLCSFNTTLLSGLPSRTLRPPAFV